MWKNWKAASIAACTGLALSAGAYAQPANDSCANAGSSPIPAAGGTVLGTTALATNDGAGCGGTIPGLDVYHAWTPVGNGPWKLSLCSTAPAWDSVMSIHTGCATSGTNLVVGTCADDVCDVLPEIASATLTGGNAYIVRISTYSSTLGIPGGAYTLVVTNLGAAGKCCASDGSCFAAPNGVNDCGSGATFTAGGVCSPNTCAQPPANDSCGNAGLAVIPAAGGTVNGTAVLATVDGEASCDETDYTAGDVYYAFTPTVAGPWRLSLCDGTPNWDTSMSVHVAGCPVNEFEGGGPGNQVACADQGCGTGNLSLIPSVTLVAGTQYYVRIAPYSNDDGFWGPAVLPQAFSLTVENLAVAGACCAGDGSCTVAPNGPLDCTIGATFAAGGVCSPNTCPQPPANDLCSGAVIIPSVPYSDLGVPIATATVDVGALGNADCNADLFDVNNGIWYRYTAASSGTLVVNEASTLDSVMAIFSGTDCSGLTFLGCSDGTPVTGNEFFYYPGALAGTTYYILVGKWGATPAGATAVVDLNVDLLPPVAPPANDDCASAMVVSTLPFDSGAIVVGGALDDADTSCNADAATVTRAGIWFSYTPATSCIMLLDQPGTIDTVTAIYSGTCGGLVEEACSDFEEVIFQATGGTQYFILVGRWSDSAGTPADTYTLTLDCVLPPPVPANDNCATATVIASVPYTSPSVQNFSATDDTNVDPSCDETAGPAHRGMWWSYTATTDQTLIVSESGIWDTAISIWTGADCNTLSEVSCQDDESFIFSFVGGTTYYILDAFWLSRATGGNPPLDAEFMISLIPVATNDLCENAIAPMLPFTQDYNTTGTNTDGPQIAAGPDCNSAVAQTQGLNYSIWYRVTAPSSGSLTVQSRSVFDALINIYSGTDCAALTFITDETCAGDGDNGAVDGFDNIDYSVTVPAGETRYIGIGSWGSTGGGAALPGSGTLTITFTPDGPVSDFCCRGTTCNPVTSGTCTGTVAGSNSTTVASCGAGNSSATCCFADFNHTGGVTIDDLFLYLNAYFTSSPYSNFGGDTVAGPTIDDLFLYINAYFTGCQP